MKISMNVKKVTLIAVFITLALIMSYLEILIPSLLFIPGAKLGLANIVIVVSLYKYGLKESITINLLRIVIINILFNNFVSFLYAISGGILSNLIMFIIKKTKKFSYTFVSISGGVSHNIGQIIVAIYLTKTKELLLYLPILIFLGIVSGIIIGLISSFVLKKLIINYDINK